MHRFWSNLGDFQPKTEKRKFHRQCKDLKKIYGYFHGHRARTRDSGQPLAGMENKTTCRNLRNNNNNNKENNCFNKIIIIVASAAPAVVIAKVVVIIRMIMM